MKIVGTRAIDASDIAVIEAHFSCKLPSEVRKFLVKYNGEIVDPEDGVLVHSVTTTGQDIKDWLTFIHHTEVIIQRLPYAANIQHMINQHKWDSDVFRMEELMPIMSTLGGSNHLYVAVIGEQAGKLFIIDNGDNGLSKVALTLPELAKKFEA